jgi:hypothetical protein
MDVGLIAVFLDLEAAHLIGTTWFCITYYEESEEPQQHPHPSVMEDDLPRDAVPDAEKEKAVPMSARKPFFTLTGA